MYTGGKLKRYENHSYFNKKLCTAHRAILQITTINKSTMKKEVTKLKAILHHFVNRNFTN